MSIFEYLEPTYLKSVLDKLNNVDVALSSRASESTLGDLRTKIYRQLLAFGAAFDDWHSYGERKIWEDTTEVTVTETSWTIKKQYDMAYRFRAFPYYRGYNYMYARVGTPPSGVTWTIYYRIREAITGRIIASGSTTSTSYVVIANNWDFYWGRDGAWGPIFLFEAYVTTSDPTYPATGYVGTCNVELWAPLLQFPFASDYDNLILSGLNKISGTPLTGRDWSQDFAKLQNIDVLLSSRLGADVSSAPDSSPPSKGVMILGFDGTYVRRIKTTADGKLLTVLG